MSELTDISRFRWLTVWLADNLVPEDIHKVQSLLKDYLKGSNTGDDALAIFDFLVKQNRIHDEDTGLLRTLFISLGRMDLLEAVNDYEREKTTVARRLGRNSSNLGGPYFGRHDTLNKLITILDTSYDHIHGICISGDAGIGKTRLALEACARMRGSHNLVTVDLHGLPSVENVYYAIMHAFGVTCREFDLDNLYGFLRGYENSRYGTTILLLDNANTMLNPGPIDHRNPTYTKFVDALRTILSIPNPGLKVMLTSTVDLDMRAGLSSKTMSRIPLNRQNGLDTDAAVRMLRYHAGNTPISYEDAKTAADKCGNNPMSIKVLASRLQDGKVQIKDILPSASSSKTDITSSLSHLSVSSHPNLHCMQSLQEQHKLTVIKLASINGPFSLEAARKILKYRKRDLSKLQYHLHDLRYLGLLEIRSGDSFNQFASDESIYKMQHSVRAFIIEYVTSQGGSDFKSFRRAQNRFVQFYGKRLRDICHQLQTDVCRSLPQLQHDVSNYVSFLKIVDDFKPVDNLWLVVLAIERLLSHDEALMVYNYMAQQAKKRGDVHVHADLRCYEISQMKELGHDPEGLLKQLVDIQDTLNQKLDNSVDVRSKQFSLANCYCLRGELLTLSNPSEAVQWLQHAVSLRKQVHGEDHFLVARALKSLGVALSKKNVLPDSGRDGVTARTCFIQAYEMCRRLANGSDKHLDIPRYIADIGDILRELGEHEDAIECMNRGVELESALGMGGAVATCAMQEKIALSYSAIERYEDAISACKKFTECRKQISGQVSPKTAHALYVLGSTCLKARNYREAKLYLTEALEIEEASWGRGLPHSDDWQRLKTSIETMMVTLQKQSALTSYRKRFQNAEDDALKGKLQPKTSKIEATESDDSLSDGSSLPSEISDECPVKPKNTVEEDDDESDASSIASEISGEFPVGMTQGRGKSEKSSDEESLPSEMSDEIPVRRSGAYKDSDDETSSNASSLPSEMSDEFPVRVDRNLNQLDKQNDTPYKPLPGKKQSSPSGSSGVDSAVDSTSVHSSDEMTARELEN